jgi:hypothetical protein
MLTTLQRTLLSLSWIGSTPQGGEMVSMKESMSHSSSTAMTSWWSRAAVVSGPLFVGIAALLVFWFAPTISGSDAPAKIEEF